MAGLLPFTSKKEFHRITLNEVNSKGEPGLYAIVDVPAGFYGVMIVYTIESYLSVQILCGYNTVKYRRSLIGEPYNYNDVDWVEL